MKVGILGVPGVEKTRFAIELADKIVADEGFHVIDDYVNDLRERTGYEYGFFGDHVDDLQVVFKRRELELQAGFLFAHTFTCGTILDSIAYTLIRSETEYKTRSLIALQQERLDTIMKTFGLLYHDTWNYDYAFYLPPGHVEQSDGFYIDRLDQAIRELITAFHAPVISLKKEKLNDNPVEIAASTIKALEEESTPASN